MPERLLRSIVGLGAGVVREAGEVALPAGLRRSRLYQNMVETTLRFLIEQVGEVEGVYGADEKLADDFLVRRTAGNAIEALGVVAFRASPVWVLAALADVCGLGRQLIPEITVALKERGLVDEGAAFSSVDELLDGLERTSGRLASAVNTPPLDVATLREEWRDLKQEIGRLGPERLPSRESVTGVWTALCAEAARQERSVYETSSMLAVSAVRRLPGKAQWLGTSALVGAERTGRVLASAVLESYSTTLQELREVGYTTYAARQLGPYARAAAAQFRPARPTVTGRLIERWRHRKAGIPR